MSPILVHHRMNYYMSYSYFASEPTTFHETIDTDSEQPLYTACVIHFKMQYIWDDLDIKFAHRR